MNQWFIGIRKQQGHPDPEILEESALAMAQATIQNAMTASGVSRAELARRMGQTRSAVTRMLSGSHNLTVKTMARALAACGHEVRFEAPQIEWGWCAGRDLQPTESRIVFVEGLLRQPLHLAHRTEKKFAAFSLGG